MGIVEAIVLGVVQGLGEFLPISSSAHLVLVPWLFSWPDPGLTFDVALHLGTLIAVVAYFWRDWLELIQKGFRQASSREGRLFWYLVLATIPGGLAGLALEHQAETVFRTPWLVGLMLILMGLLLYLADHKGRKQINLWGIRWQEALLIGLAQAFAIIPGVSRSGVTIAAARALGINREAATRFSFLLSTPIILGAGVLKLKDLSPGDLNLFFFSGVAAAAITGFAAIAFLLRFVTTHNFNIFVWYRFLLGAGVIFIFLLRLH
ncbi:undecaprenyl-diphosphatase UppP [Ammonifex thiophilus]|uniref:Undecaprenyl-diphosphatase n=1 Tax=Ammonifex thiophilus TaxID=444093 RepID=A0A3D8P655_9THEO|nr:undecaprenyl-diphosphatase UppP [Ammonifex thiophilus]